MKKAVMMIVWALAMLPFLLALNCFGLYVTTELKLSSNYLYYGYFLFMTLIIILMLYKNGNIFYRHRHMEKREYSHKDGYCVLLWFCATCFLLFSECQVALMTETNVTLHNLNCILILYFSGFLWIGSIPFICCFVREYYKIYVQQNPPEANQMSVTPDELLKQMYGQECYKRLCYSENYAMNTPKDGYEKEWKESCKRVKLLKQMIDELGGMTQEKIEAEADREKAKGNCP